MKQEANHITFISGISEKIQDGSTSYSVLILIFIGCFISAVVHYLLLTPSYCITCMFEFLLGLFITAMLNGIWQSRDVPERHPRYWSKEDNAANVWREMDSTLFERVYEFDNTRYFGDSAAMRAVVPDTTAKQKPDSLLLNGL